MSTINPEVAMLIGRNEHGYEFGVMLQNGAWWGCAIGTTGEKNQMIFFFPDCDSQNMYPRICDEVRNEVIKRTIAYALHPEHGYGGISTYFVDESLRTVPRDYICLNCDEFLCEGDCAILEDFDLEVDDSIYEEPEESFGSCCECEKNGKVRNIWMLDKKTPIPGKGWGCFTCDLPADGAIAVLCDDCHEKLSANSADPKFACKGYPASDGRVLFDDLAGSHEHNFAHQ